MTPNKLTKRRLVTSFQNLTPDLQESVKEHYPLGYTDAMMRIDKPNGDFFYAVPFETDEIFYLVKIDVKIDDSANLEKELFSEDIKEAEDALKDSDAVELDPDAEM